MKPFKVHCHNAKVGRLNHGGLLLQIGFCSFESCLAFVKCFIIPCLWKVIFLWDFRICLVFVNTVVISHVILCGLVPSYWHFGGAVLDDFLASKISMLFQNTGNSLSVSMD